MNSTRYANMMSNHPDMVQAVPAMPMDNAAWSGSNSLGNVVDYAPDAENRQTILKLDEWGPPEMWTISLGIDRDNVIELGHSFALFEIRALIDFGTGGATQRVTVDWINGTVLSVPMNAVTIIAEYFNSDPSLLAVTDGSLRLSALIARGARSGVYPPSMTLFFPDTASLPDDQWQSFILPRFTREIEIIWPYSFSDPFATCSPGALLLFGDGYFDATSPIGLVTLSLDPTVLTNQARFRIPLGVRAISMYNPTPGTNLRFYVNCYLGL